MAAIATALLIFSKAGDHILVADTVYLPTRKLCDGLVRRFGVETTYYDPTIGAGIARLMRPNTALVFTESPGSLTFEVQDIPAITDNTWASPLYFKPFAHGVDISIQAGTKYIVGHADAMLGATTTTERLANTLVTEAGGMGICAGTEEMYLANAASAPSTCGSSGTGARGSRSRAGSKGGPRSRVCCIRRCRAILSAGSGSV